MAKQVIYLSTNVNTFTEIAGNTDNDYRFVADGVPQEYRRQGLQIQLESALFGHLHDLNGSASRRHIARHLRRGNELVVAVGSAGRPVLRRGLGGRLCKV